MTAQTAHSGASASGRFSRLTTAFLVLALVLPTEQIGRVAGQLISVIVREAPGAGDLPEQLVAASGGTVGLRLAIINGFEAQIPAKAVEWLDESPAIEEVTPNVPLKLQELLIHPSRPGMAVLRPVHLLFKMENHGRAVLVKEPPAV